jgi:hypothetical protein
MRCVRSGSRSHLCQISAMKITGQSHPWCRGEHSSSNSWCSSSSRSLLLQQLSDHSCCSRSRMQLRQASYSAATEAGLACCVVAIAILAACVLY